MECAYCGIEFNKNPYYRDGEVYCCKECANAASGELRDDYDFDDDDIDGEDIDDYGIEFDDDIYKDS